MSTINISVSQSSQAAFLANWFGANLFGCKLAGRKNVSSSFLPIGEHVSEYITYPVASTTTPITRDFMGMEDSFVQRPIVPPQVAQKGMPVVSLFSKNIYQGYPYISRAFALSGNINQALELFESALQIDLGSDMRNAELQLHVASSLAQTGFSQRAMEVYDELLAMLDSYEAEDRPKTPSSEGMIRILDDLKLRTGFRIKIAESLAQRGFKEHAMQVADELLIKLDTYAREDAETVFKHMQEQEIAFGKFLTAFGIDASEDTEHPRLNCMLPFFLGRMARLDYARLKLEIGNILVEAGFTERALELFNEFLKVEQLDPNEYLLPPGHKFFDAQFKKKIGEAIAQAGLYNEALEVDTGDRAGNIKLRFSVGKIMIGAGKFDKALEVDTGLEEHNIELMLAVGEAVAKRGDAERALELFEEALTRISSNYKKVELRTAIGIAMERAGYRDRTLAVLEGTLDVRSDDSMQNAFENLKVAKAMIQAGFTVHAEDVLDEILLTNVKDTKRGMWLKEAVGKALAQAGLFEKALDVDTGDSNANINLKVAVGISMLEAGFIPDALELFDDVVKSLDENSVFNKLPYVEPIVESLLEARMFDEARAIVDTQKNQAHLKKITGIAMAKAGMVQEAFSIETGDRRFTAEMRQNVIETMVNAVSTLINASRGDVGVA